MHALDYFKRRLHHFGLLAGDHAVLADLLHGFGNDAANLLVGVGTDCADLGDHAALHLAREPLNLSEGNFNGIIDAAIERHRACAGGYRSHAFTEIAWASTVAVVPSPATSEVWTQPRAPSVHPCSQVDPGARSPLQHSRHLS